MQRVDWRSVLLLSANAALAAAIPGMFLVDMYGAQLGALARVALPGMAG